MKTLVVVVALLVYQTTAAPQRNQLVSKAVNEFSIKLYKEVAEESGNVLVTSFNVHKSLSDLLLEARGNTSRELEAVLGFGDTTSLQWPSEEYKSLLTKLQSDYGLRMMDKTFSLPDVEDKLLMKYKIKEIANQLVDQTFNQANFKPDENDLLFCSIDFAVLNADQKALFMFNTVSFNTTWKTPFIKVVKSQFHPFSDESFEAEFMLVKDEFDYKHDAVLEAKVLKMDYTSEDYSMVFVLPDREDGIPALEDKLAQTDLRTLTHDLYRTEVNVAVLQFDLISIKMSKENVKEMGINEQFDNSIFQGIPNISLGHLSKIGVEKSFGFQWITPPVKTNNFGEGRDQFHANRPFLYFCMYQDTVLFQGRIESSFDATCGIKKYGQVK